MSRKTKLSEQKSFVHWICIGQRIIRQPKANAIFKLINFMDFFFASILIRLPSISECNWIEKF